MVNRGFSLLEKVQKLLEKIYNRHYDVALVTNDEWTAAKDEFIVNKNNNISYQYIPLELEQYHKEKKEVSDHSITSQAIDLFGEDMISIN